MRGVDSKTEWGSSCFMTVLSDQDTAAPLISVPNASQKNSGSQLQI